MTEFLDGVRDGAKGEVVDLTTVNFDAMELRKLLSERNAWATRLAKLDGSKGSITAEIWKKLRNEYDQKLKARENELLTVRDKMSKKLDEMGKLKDSVEKEFPGLHKRREELNLRFELGDFNQEFYDYVSRELNFQIDLRQKKVEVLGRNIGYYRESLALEDVPAGEKATSSEGDKKAASDSEGLGKGGGSSGSPLWAPPVAERSTPRRLPEPEPAPEAENGAIEEEEDPQSPITYINVPPEEADELEEGLEGGGDPEEVAAAEGDGGRTTEEQLSVPEAEEEVEEELEEEVTLDSSQEGVGYLDSIPEMGDTEEAVPHYRVSEGEETEAEEEPAPAAGSEDGAAPEVSEVEEVETVDDVVSDEEVEEVSYGEAAEVAPQVTAPIGRAKSTGLHPDREIELGDESGDVHMEVPTVTPPSPRPIDSSALHARGVAAITEISNVFARGAQSDPEREEAKKILEEVNLEELERAVEGIEGEADDEELRGFVRDVSGRRGEGTAPPPAVLEVVEGINLGKVFPLSRTSNVTSIGKAPDNTIAMPEDKALSRYHAKIIFRQNRFVIMDLDSTNGTGVNGEAVTECDLSDEDEIIMGGSRYIFRITSRS